MLNYKDRQSNFELLRLVSMLLVLILHSCCLSIGNPLIEDIRIAPFFSSIRVLIESFSLVCVNVFVLISGWFGIKPNVKGFLNFIFQCLFFSVLVTILAPIFGIGTPLSLNDIGGFLFFGKYYYWFIKCYICLYILAPILNSFVQTADRRVFLIVLIGLFLMQSFYGWTGYMVDYDRGMSVLSFVNLYLLARYIRLFGENVFSYNKWLDLTVYFVISVSVASIYLLAEIIGLNKVASHMLLFINPAIIISSVFLMLFFSKLRIKSHTINYLSQSAFAVYLFHLNSKVWDKFLTTSYEILTLNSGLKAFFISLVFIIGVFILAILIDQLRLMSWSFIEKRFL